MSDSKEAAITGYIVAVLVMAALFWLVLGDAYGRFMIAFDPGKSLMSGYLRPYARGLTGLVCLAAPLLLAYFLRGVVGRWVDSTIALSTRFLDWLMPRARKLAAVLWHYGSSAVCSLWKTRSGKRNGHRQ